MITNNQNSTPCILFTDNPEIAQLFNKEQQEGNNITNIFKVINDIYNDTDSVLFLSNNDNHFISLEYQHMLNSTPKIVLELLETGEFFESRLLRSPLQSVLAQSEKYKDYSGPIRPPYTRFYIAFGIGDDSSYWSSFNSFMLVSADTFSNFNSAKVVTLSFVPNISLYGFNLDGIRPFIPNEVLTKTELNIYEQLRLFYLLPNDIERNSERRGDSEYFTNRKLVRYGAKLARFLETLENMVDRTLQTIFNTPNVLVLCPTDSTKFPYINSILENAGIKGNDLANFFPLINAIVDQYAIDFDRYQASPAFPVRLALPPSFGADEKNWQLFLTVLDNVFKLFNMTIGQGTNTEKLLDPNDYDPLPQQQSITESTISNFNALSARSIVNSELSDVKDSLVYLQCDSMTIDQMEKNITKIISKLISGYSDLTGESNFTIFVESDISILKALDEDLKNVTGFGLPRMFDPNEPLVIFGDLKTIASVIYQKGLVDYPPFKLKGKGQSKLSAVLDDKLKKSYNLYNSQNFTGTTLEDYLNELNNSQISQNIGDLVREKNLPVFKYNTVNPNTLSVQVNDNKAYHVMLTQSYRLMTDYSSLKTAFYKDPTNKYLELSGAILSNLRQPGGPNLSRVEWTSLENALEENKNRSYLLEFYKLSEDKRKEFLLNNENLLTESELEKQKFLRKFDDQFTKYNRAYKSVTDIGGPVTSLPTPEEFFKLTYEKEIEVFSNFIRRNSDVVTLIENSYANDPIKFFVDQMNYIDQVTFQLEIETLPFFPISTPLYMFTPTILFAVRPRLTGDSKLSNPLDSISGVYNILGFFHKIDSSRAYSKFKLFSVPEERRVLKR